MLSGKSHYFYSAALWCMAIGYSPAFAQMGYSVTPVDNQPSIEIHFDVIGQLAGTPTYVAEVPVAEPAKEVVTQAKNEYVRDIAETSIEVSQKENKPKNNINEKSEAKTDKKVKSELNIAVNDSSLPRPFLKKSNRLEESNLQLKEESKSPSSAILAQNKNGNPASAKLKNDEVLAEIDKKSDSEDEIKKPSFWSWLPFKGDKAQTSDQKTALSEAIKPTHDEPTSETNRADNRDSQMAPVEDKKKEKLAAPLPVPSPVKEKNTVKELATVKEDSREKIKKSKKLLSTVREKELDNLPWNKGDGSTPFYLSHTQGNEKLIQLGNLSGQVSVTETNQGDEIVAGQIDSIISEANVKNKQSNEENYPIIIPNEVSSYTETRNMAWAPTPKPVLKPFEEVSVAKKQDQKNSPKSEIAKGSDPQKIEEKNTINSEVQISKLKDTEAKNKNSTKKSSFFTKVSHWLGSDEEEEPMQMVEENKNSKNQLIASEPSKIAADIKEEVKQAEVNVVATKQNISIATNNISSSILVPNTPDNTSEINNKNVDVPAFKPANMVPVPTIKQKQVAERINKEAEARKLAYSQLEEMETRKKEEAKLKALASVSKTMKQEEQVVVPVEEAVSVNMSTITPKQNTALNLTTGEEGAGLYMRFAEDEVNIRGEDKTQLLELVQRELVGNNKKLKIISYASANNQNNNSARRVALQRAIATRQQLIEAGMTSSRISVQAISNQNDGKNQVEVYLVE